MKKFNKILKDIAENFSNGYETAIVSDNNKKCVKHGSYVEFEFELPDKPKYCQLIIWNNDNIDTVLSEYQKLINVPRI